MSRDWINWRFGVRHLQVGKWYVTFRVNPYHIENPPDKFFQRYV